jgi:PAS domain S-box-containing protein
MVWRRQRPSATELDHGSTQTQRGGELSAALDAIVGESLRPVCAGLAALFLFYAASHLLVQPKAIAPRLAFGAAVTALIFFVLYVGLRRRPAAPRWAHPFATFILGLVLITNLLFMQAVPEPRQTTNLMLLVIGAGCFFLSVRWLVGFLAATLAGWAIIAATSLPSHDWNHFGFALASAIALSIIIHTLRVRTYARLEGLRLRDEARNAELAAALAAAETSREAVEASKNDLERAMEATQESEERHRQTSETLHTLIAASPLAIFAIDSTGLVRSWNAAAERIFGWKQEEVLGRPHSMMLAETKEAFVLVERVLRGESLTGVELLLRRKEGRWIDISLSAAPLCQQQGSAGGAVAVVADITERKKAEEDARRLILEQAARAQAEEAQQRLALADQRKDEFLAMLAHELRNPLGAVSNAAELLQRFGPDEPRLRRALKTIEREVGHQAHLLDYLLDMSRITRGKISLRRVRLELRQLVGELAEDRHSDVEAAGLTLSLELPEQPVWVRGDPTRLAQVVGNLLHNAVKFSEPGGHVWVRLRVETSEGLNTETQSHLDERAEQQRADEEGVALATSPVPSASPGPPSAGNLGAGGSFAALSVRDTGIGIEPEMLPRVFDTFAQADRSLDRSRGGLGLGLALVKGLVELHGGGVRAESAGLGHGANFVVWLPIVPEPAASPNVSTPAPVPSGPIRVLIVEDNRAAADTLRELLKLSGCTVEVAYSGPAALTAAREFHPEVVLCDLGLPGMDGFQVAKALRQDPATASARLIAVTGYGQEEDRRRAREAGFELHLTKPIRFAELQRLLEITPERRQV